MWDERSFDTRSYDQRSWWFGIVQAVKREVVRLQSMLTKMFTLFSGVK